jgi:hypothetical protein
MQHRIALPESGEIYPELFLISRAREGRDGLALRGRHIYLRETDWLRYSIYDSLSEKIGTVIHSCLLPEEFRYSTQHNQRLIERFWSPEYVIVNLDPYGRASFNGMDENECPVANEYIDVDWGTTLATNQPKHPARSRLIRSRERLSYLPEAEQDLVMEWRGGGRNRYLQMMQAYHLIMPAGSKLWYAE